jgi:hypothetical protein
MALSHKAETAILLALEVLLKGQRGKAATEARDALNRALENRGDRMPEQNGTW